MYQTLSNCCQSEIITMSQREFPFGGSTWGINYLSHVCSKCRQDCHEEEYSVCDYCGEIGELKNGYCSDCITDMANIGVIEVV